jgi:ankyrin repeat protein
MPTEDVVSTVPGVTRRVTVRETSLGEDVIFCKLIRDGILRHFNPWKLSDLQRVLEMRCFGGLLSDEDLKEVYFQRMWGFQEETKFVLAGWREMSVEYMKGRIWWALDYRLKRTPGMEEHLMALGTKEEIMREYGMLAYVPREIVNNALRGAWVLRQVRGVGVENLGGLKLKERKECLRYACRAGVDFSIIRSLYESLSGPALMHAAANGHTATVNALAGTYNANVEAVSRKGTTALMCAAEHGHMDIVNALAGTYNANVEAATRFGWTALMRAAQDGHTATVNALAGTYNANVHAVDEDGKTALMWAAMKGHTATVDALAGMYNANVHAVDEDGKTALMWAASKGHTGTVNALAGTYNANVEAVTRKGETALMLAAKDGPGHTDTVNALVGTHGANVEAGNRNGETALMFAAMKGHTRIVNALAGTHNANVEAVDRNGLTALMLAAMKGHTDTVHALRRHGATR